MGSMLLAAHQASGRTQAADGHSASGPPKIRISVIFAGTPTPADRSWGVCEQEITAMQQRLTEIEKKLGNVEFVVGRAAQPEQAAELMKRAGDGAPVLAINRSKNGSKLGGRRPGGRHDDLAPSRRVLRRPHAERAAFGRFDELAHRRGGLNGSA
jgi:hypothetical protein